METQKKFDLTIVPGKSIIISSSDFGMIIRNGNLKNFAWDSKQNFIFNPTYGTESKYDYMLPYGNIGTYNGGAVPGFSALLVLLKAEIESES